MIGAIETAVNAIIGGVNKILGLWNNLSISSPRVALLGEDNYSSVHLELQGRQPPFQDFYPAVAIGWVCSAHRPRDG